jgi:hypothetical protein
MHEPEQERRYALALSLIVIAFLAFLLFSLPAKADGIVLVCQEGKPCTVETARIFFVVKVEDDRLPTACLTAAMSKTAEVSQLIGPDELARIDCGRR